MRLQVIFPELVFLRAAIFLGVLEFGVLLFGVLFFGELLFGVIFFELILFVALIFDMFSNEVGPFGNFARHFFTQIQHRSRCDPGDNSRSRCDGIQW